MAKRSSKASTPTTPSARLNHHRRLAWLRLIRSDLWDPPPSAPCTEAKAAAELELAESLGASLVAIGELG